MKCPVCRVRRAVMLVTETGEYMCYHCSKLEVELFTEKEKKDATDQDD